MDRECKHVIELTAAVLADKKIDTSELDDLNWSYIHDISCFHGISSIISYAVDILSNIPDDVKRAFINARRRGIYLDTHQEIVAQKLLNLFEENGIDCMILKGYWIKKVYPSPDMRMMGDIDILIKETEFSAAKRLLEEYGFVFETESRHELIFRREPHIKIELHKTVIPPYNHDLYAYYGSGWRFAKKSKGYKHVYELSPEDFYVYIIAHAAKHYLNAGFGIRQVADIYVLRNSNFFDNIDIAYIKNEIEKMHLTKFYNLLIELVEKWFDRKQPTSDISEMEEYILRSGIYGIDSRKGCSAIYRNSSQKSYRMAKRESIWRLFFPKLIYLRAKHPRLDKYPILYPVYVLKRIFKIIFTKRDQITQRISEKLIPDAEIEKYAKHWESLGINKTL